MSTGADAPDVSLPAPLTALDGQEEGLEALQAGTVWGDCSSSAFPFEGCLFASDWEHFVRSSMQQQARLEEEKTLDAAPSSADALPLFPTLQSWTEAALLTSAPKRRASMHEEDLRSHRPLPSFPEDLLFPLQPSSSVAQFIPVSGWQVSGASPAPLCGAAPEPSQPTLLLFRDEPAAQPRRRPLGELDSNALNKDWDEIAVRKKRQEGFKGLTKEKVRGTKTSFATKSSAPLNQEEEQWLCGVNTALQRASHLAEEEALLQARLSSIDALPAHVPANLHARPPCSEHSLGFGRGLELATEEDVPLAFSGRFTSRGFQIDRVGPQPDETLEGYLRTRTTCASRALSDSVWRVHGKQLLTLGPSPLNEKRPGIQTTVSMDPLRRESTTTRTNLQSFR